jgi:hypothetical protein
MKTYVGGIVEYKDRFLHVTACIWEFESTRDMPSEFEIDLLTCTKFNEDYLQVLKRYSSFNKEVYQEIEDLIYEMYLKLV